MTEYTFAVTENARNRIILLAKKRGEEVAMRLRISILGGGCSGFQYKYEMVSDIGAQDIEFGNGTVVVDDLSIAMINGSTLDYVEDLGSAGFEMKNPNAAARCGCGNSFAPSA